MAAALPGHGGADRARRLDEHPRFGADLDRLAGAEEVIVEVVRARHPDLTGEHRKAARRVRQRQHFALGDAVQNPVGAALGHQKVLHLAHEWLLRRMAAIIAVSSPRIK